MNSSSGGIRVKMLARMLRHNIFGEKHMDFEHLHSGFPSHLAREVRQVAKELIREGWLLTKPAHYGLQVSLNPRKAQEIKECVQRHLAEADN